MTDKEWDRFTASLSTWSASHRWAIVCNFVRTRERRAWKAGRDAAVKLCLEESDNRRRAGTSRTAGALGSTAIQIEALQPPDEKETTNDDPK